LHRKKRVKKKERARQAIPPQAYSTKKKKWFSRDRLGIMRGQNRLSNPDGNDQAGFDFLAGEPIMKIGIAYCTR
jgi:hypothetical protein